MSFADLLRRPDIGLLAARPDCAHHYHADDRGWHCCHCPTRARWRRNSPPPAGGRVDCNAPAADEDSPRAWLAPPRKTLTRRVPRQRARTT